MVAAPGFRPAGAILFRRTGADIDRCAVPAHDQPGGNGTAAAPVRAMDPCAGGAGQRGRLMLQFEWPWFLLALPIPWLARVLLRAWEPGQEAALRVPFLEDFRQQTGSVRLQSASWPLWLAALAWLFLVLAGMRPQWQGELIEIPVSGREMILAVDLSASMQEEDFFITGDAVDRLTAAKYVAGDFIERRGGDRLR